MTRSAEGPDTGEITGEQDRLEYSEIFDGVAASVLPIPDEDFGPEHQLYMIACSELASASRRHDKIEFQKWLNLTTAIADAFPESVKAVEQRLSTKDRQPERS